MSHMEWDAKASSPWDWDSLGLFCGKFSEAPNLAQSQYVDEVRDEPATIYPSFGSGSELGNGCSSKSTISASLDSSRAITVTEIDFEAMDGLPKITSKSRKSARVEDSGTSAAVVDVAAQPSILLKKSKTTQQNIQNSYCQVEDCNMDLTNAKDYHRKHRVCEKHSKSPKVVVAGQDRRFCQQCSRFHELSEFDQKKRSCRRRLSDHNARRRKPQPDTISFSSGTTLSFYDNRQQINLLWNRAPYQIMKPSTTSTSDGLCDFKFTQARESWVKPVRDGVTELCFPSEGISNHANATRHEPDRLMAFEDTNAIVLKGINAFNIVSYHGPEASAVASNVEGARVSWACSLSSVI